MALRRALIDLGMGLWLNEPAAKNLCQGTQSLGKHGGVVACALAHRANRIAHALVRDHATTNRPAGLKPPPPGKGTAQNPSQPQSVVPLNRRDEGPDRCRNGYGGPSPGYAASVLAPGLRLHGSPNDAR